MLTFGKRYKSFFVACILLLRSAASAKASSQTSFAFGNVPLGNSQLTVISFSAPSGIQPFTPQPQYGSDFFVGPLTCPSGSSGTCSVQVSFVPATPGFHSDAVRILDANSNVVKTILLSGVGEGAAAVLWPGVVQAFAGNGTFGSGGDNQAALNASLEGPQGLALDGSGNLYIADAVAQVIRKVAAGTSTITSVAGNGRASTLGDGGPATAAMLNVPSAVALDGAGNLYIADSQNNRVRRVDATSGIISTVAGGGASCSSNLGDGGAATSACLSQPSDIALDPAGNLFIADTYNNRIRKVDTSGTITTIAGGGSGNSGVDAIGDGGPATAAVLSDPASLALDNSGNLFIADSGNNVIRVVQGGIIGVVAGNRSPGYGGDGGSAKTASLTGPLCVRTDAAGSLYIADAGNAVVRRVDPTGMIQTIAGTGGQFGFSENGILATLAVFDTPVGLAISPANDLYIADPGNFEVRVVSTFTGTLDLGNANIGELTAPQTLTLVDYGNQPFTINALTFSANFVQQSSGTRDCVPAAKINPGLSCAITMAAVPTSAGSLTGTLNVTSSAGSQALALQNAFLSVTGVGGSSAVPTLNSLNLAFPSQILGSASTVENVRLQNNGSSTITLALAQLSGSDVNDFNVQTGGCSSVLPSSSCNLAVSFSPSGVGSRTSSLILTETDGTVTYSQSVLLSGTGTNAAPVVGPGTVDLGTGALHIATARKVVTLTNPGPLGLSIAGISLSASSDFAITDSSCGSNIAGGGSCVVGLSFTPSVAGPQTGTLTFADSDPSSPQTVQLTGSGAAPPTGSGAVPLGFVPVTPCRVVDTRNPIGPLGGPEIAAGTARSFPVAASACGIPGSATAYSLNVTAVPEGPLGYMTIWPTGASQPYVSTLNSDGRIKANAAIVPAGSNGSVSVYASQAAHVVVDINGYFLPSTAPSSLAFYKLSPCRVIDTRETAGPLGGPSLAANGTRVFPLLTSTCNLPSSAQAFALNFTVVPHGAFGFLTTWPTGVQQPYVSTLNAFTGTTTANAAIVPAGPGGEVSVYVTDNSDLIVDLNGYFAPPATNGLFFYTSSECRVFDSRSAIGPGLLNGVVQIAAFAATCGLPVTAQAYVTNATVEPVGSLGYLSLWPDAESRPLVSTLNAFDGATTSNMAIVPTVNGSIDGFVSSAGNLILDVSGYFAP